MHDELSARQRALTLRLAGRSVKDICQALAPSEVWFRKGWCRYRELGAEGLFDLTRANHQVARRIPPALEETLLAIRRRREGHAGSGARYRLFGASALLAERKALHLCPLPSLSTSNRVRQRHGITPPRLRLARPWPRQPYPSPQAERSNQRHEVDVVGPIYRKGRSRRSYLWGCKDRFDGAVGRRLVDCRKRDAVLGFRGECGKSLGLPEEVQSDNARERCGWGQAARLLSRVIRLGLRLGVGPVFLPDGEPPCNGSAENFNGWFQPRWFERRFARPGVRRRELAVLAATVNTQHVHPRLGGLTPAQHRCRQRLRKRPQRYVIPTAALPLTAARVTLLRRVSLQGTVSVLDQPFRVGQRPQGLSVQGILDTGRGRLTAYLNGRVLKRWPYKRLNE